jgi:hypothetical protein
MPMKCRAIGLDYLVDANPRNASAKREYLVYDIETADTPNDVIAKILQTAPVFLTITVPNLQSAATSLSTGVIYRTFVSDLKFIGHNAAVGTMNWGLVDAAPHPEQGGPQPEETPESQQHGPECSFDTGTGTQHITQSLVTKARKIAGGGIFSAPDMGGAIGVSRDRVEGCDIGSGVEKWSITLKGVPVTPAYRRKVRKLRYTLNESEIFSALRQEILFVGATFNFRPGDGWVATYNFEQGDTIDSKEVAPGITLFQVKPFDYIWTSYADKADGTALFQQPIAVYHEQVYPEGDLAELFRVTP